MQDLNELLDKLGQLSDGELLLTSAAGVWHFYMLDGQLLYAAGSKLAVRQFTRAASCHRPRWKWTVKSDWLSDQRTWAIPLIEHAIAYENLSPIQAKIILRMVLEECLFELLYDGEVKSEWRPCHLEVSSDYRAAALSIAEVQRILEKAQRLVDTWKAGDLGHVRLSDSPVMTDRYSDDRGSLSPNLADGRTPRRPLSSRYLKGNHDLWDILVIHAPSLNGLTELLQPLVEQGAIEFRSTPDLKLPLTTSPAMPPQLASDISTQNPASLPSPLSSTSVASPTQGASTVGLSNTRPAGRTTQPTASTVASSAVPLIACIDDSPVLTLSLKRILTSAGYRTLSIPEPMRGFSKLIEHRPNLILLDLMLPNADGYSICKFLRETPVFEDTPIIILTGQDSNLDRIRAKLVGATEFLTKPPQADTLLAMVSQHLGAS